MGEGGSAIAYVTKKGRHVAGLQLVLMMVCDLLDYYEHRERRRVEWRSAPWRLGGCLDFMQLTASSSKNVTAADRAARWELRGTDEAEEGTEKRLSPLFQPYLFLLSLFGVLGFRFSADPHSFVWSCIARGRLRLGSSMALDAATAQEMIKKLADDQTQYLNTLNRAHELLAQALTAASTGQPAPRLTTEGIRRITNSSAAPKIEVESVKKNSKGSILSAEDEEPSTEDNESLYVSQNLPSRQYDEDGFRKHLHEHEWTDAGKAILCDLLGNKHVVHKKSIFSTAPKELKDRSQHSHYSIFDGM